MVMMEEEAEGKVAAAACRKRLQHVMVLINEFLSPLERTHLRSAAQGHSSLSPRPLNFPKVFEMLYKNIRRRMDSSSSEEMEGSPFSHDQWSTHDIRPEDLGFSPEGSSISGDDDSTSSGEETPGGGTAKKDAPLIIISEDELSADEEDARVTSFLNRHYAGMKVREQDWGVEINCSSSSSISSSHSSEDGRQPIPTYS